MSDSDVYAWIIVGGGMAAFVLTVWGTFLPPVGTKPEDHKAGEKTRLGGCFAAMAASAAWLFFGGWLYIDHRGWFWVWAAAAALWLAGWAKLQVARTKAMDRYLAAQRAAKGGGNP